MTDETLSEGQLKQLLQDAAQRLKDAKQNKALQTQNTLPDRIPKLAPGDSITPYVTTTAHGAHVNPSHLVAEKERKLSNGTRQVQDPVDSKAKATLAKKATAGSNWYNLPATQVTPELKRDLQLLRMRSVLDPKRHYKKEESRPQIPAFSQMGTIIQGPTEFFSARLTNKDRKRTFVEEILAGENNSGRFRSKYQEIQATKTSGKKEFYKKLSAGRRCGISKGG